MHELFHELCRVVGWVVTCGCGHQNQQRIDLPDKELRLILSHTHTHVKKMRDSDRHTDRQRDRQTDRETDRQTDRETDRQTDRQ